MKSMGTERYYVLKFKALVNSYMKTDPSLGTIGLHATSQSQKRCEMMIIQEPRMEGKGTAFYPLSSSCSFQVLVFSFFFFQYYYF